MVKEAAMSRRPPVSRCSSRYTIQRDNVLPNAGCLRSGSGVARHGKLSIWMQLTNSKHSSAGRSLADQRSHRNAALSSPLGGDGFLLMTDGMRVGYTGYHHSRGAPF